MDYQTVLIVDRCEETHEVMQTVLERHGVRTLAARNATAGRNLAREHRPDVIVLDAEMDDLAEDAFLAPVDSPRMILLGKMRRPGDESSRAEVIAKPYHYAALIRKIEGLLAVRGAASSPLKK